MFLKFKFCNPDIGTKWHEFAHWHELARTVNFYLALRQPFIAKSCKELKMHQNN